MADRTKYIAFLSLTSFMGAVPGASHWYANIWFNKERTDLDHAISKREAAVMNKSDNRFDRESTWSPGDVTSRYGSKEDAIKVAKERWREIAPDAKVLVEGDSFVGEPQPVLEGLPDETMNKLNALYQVCEDLGWWDGKNTEEVEKNNQEWFALLSIACNGEESG